MPFEIEDLQDVGKNIQKTVKKNWPVILAVVGGGGVILYFMSRGGEPEPEADYLPAYPPPPPEQSFPVGVPAGGGAYDTSGMEELLTRQEEYMNLQGEAFSQMASELAYGQELQTEALYESLTMSQESLQETLSGFMENFSGVVARQGERIEEIEAGYRGLETTPEVPSVTPEPTPTQTGTKVLDLANEQRYLSGLVAQARQTGNRGLETWAQAQAREYGVTLAPEPVRGDIGAPSNEVSRISAGASKPLDLANEQRYLSGLVSQARQSGNKGLETWAQSQAKSYGISLSN